MDGSDLRTRRKALGLTLQQLGDRLGMTGSYIGRMERNDAPVEQRTALAVGALRPDPLPQPAALKSSDPLERMIEQALVDAGIPYFTDRGGETESRLDFYLPSIDVAIEVKRFYSTRTGEQMARAPNVIVAQGEAAVRFLAAAIRSGDFLDMAAGASPFAPKDRRSIPLKGTRGLNVG
jgi:transcriptional regulator with XRE-family HTH domain